MKRIRSSIFAIGLLVLATPLAAQQRMYLDPSLRPLLDADWRSEVAATRSLGVATRGEDRPGSGLAIEAAAAGAMATVGVFVQVDGPAGLDELRAAGAEIGTVIGDIATARVPLDAFERLAGARAIRAIEAARFIAVDHDSSMRAIRADRVRELVGGEWTGATGAGVLVGIYDTGLDFRHGDFRRSDGSTRVRALWDQIGTNQAGAAVPPPGFTYGFLCSAAAIQNAIAGQESQCPQRDIVGHGTHVAGTAAGDGSAGTFPFRYAGVAPGAELIIVKGGNGSFSEERVVDGLNWMRQQGQALGMPVVANLSLGGQYGPHDGSRLYERAIDMMSGPGFIVVTSAGNEGENMNTTPQPDFVELIHARGHAVPGVNTQFTFRITPYTPITEQPCNGNFVLFSLWYGAQDSLRVTVTRPNGSSAVARRGVQTNDAQPTGGIFIDNGSDGPDPETGQVEAYIQVSGCGGGGVPAAGTWRINVQADGPASGAPYDIWLWAQFMGQDGRVTGVTGFDNRYIISSPGTAERVIAVGAFATRHCWPAGANEVCYVAREPIGDIARFSSAGPTRDGRRKPDITAPGIGVVSSLSTHASVTAQRIVGNAHFALEGTSMASPHVAGAIALLLEERSDLTPEDVRYILDVTARQDQFTTRTYGSFAGARPEDWWGAGKLDVESALTAVEPGIPIARLDVVPARDTLPVGATTQLRAEAYSADDEPVFARPSWSSTNPAVATVSDQGVVRALATGTAEIVASAGGLTASAVIVVQPPAVLTVATASASPDTVVRAPRGTRLPLLAVSLTANGPEAIDVRQLGFEVSGDDPAARVRLYRDVAGDGQLDANDPLLAEVQTALTPAATEITMALTGLQVPRGGTLHLILAVEVSGSAPNLAAYQARLLPDEVRTVGVRSGAIDRIEFPSPPVASAPAVTTLLAPGQLFSLSENPIRGQQLILNFRDAPTRVELYTLAGGRVADLRSGLEEDTRIRWDLRNDRSQRVAPGVYLLIIETGGETFRERLFILTPAATAGQE